MRYNLIALLTDFGTRDNYVGTLKGVIFKINPHAQILDICHEVPPQDIMNAAYLLYASYRYFPKGTIFVVVVDPGVGTRRRAVCVKTKDYLFLAPDNGVLSLTLKILKIEKKIFLTNSRYFLNAVSSTFHARDIFAPVASYLSKGLSLNQLGREIKSIKRINFPKPTVCKDGVLEGEVIHIDRFGNIITNISDKDFEDFQKGISSRSFEIRTGKARIRKISCSYSEVRLGRVLAIFGSTNLLEVSLNQGNASKVLEIYRGDRVILSKDISYGAL
jgi:hypothetical protein